MKFCYWVVFMLLLQGCGGGGSSSSDSVVASSQTSSSSSQIVLPEECVFRSKASISPNAPAIELLGGKVISLNVGATYLDAGAVAKDMNGADVSIAVTGLENVNTNVEGDYLIRYDATDSENRVAKSMHRIVRVASAIPVKYSLRKFESTSAPMGFLEHLPVDIGEDPQKLYPLLIVAHGWEHFVQQSPPNNRLSTLLIGTNIYRVFDENRWSDSRPFIVLAPQRCLNIGDNEWHQVDQLLDWALNTYPIDSHRIYMTGMSAGAYFTYRYPVLYPDRLAAIAPISAGGPVETPAEISSFCTVMQSIPIWAFHGSTDDVVPLNHTLFTLDTLAACSVSPTPKPRLTVIRNGGHLIADQVWNDQTIGLGEPAYDIQTESIYDWFLRYSLSE